MVTTIKAVYHKSDFHEFLKFIFNSFLSLFLLVSLFVVSAINPVVGILFFSVVIFALLLLKKRDILLTFYLYCVVFQNQFIAYITPLLSSDSVFTFTLLHGFNFFIAVILFIYFFIYFKRINKGIAKPALIIGLLLLIVGVYFVFGFLVFGLQPSAAYLRLFTIPLLMFFNGLLIARFASEETLKYTLLCLLIVICFLALVQFSFPRQSAFLLNDFQYFKIKKGIHSIDELLELYKTSFLNIAVFPDVYRVSSVIKSIISYGYVVSILSIFLFFKKSKALMLFFILIAIITVGSKGASLLLALFWIFHILKNRVGFSLGLTLGIFCLFWTLFIYIGYRAHNEHLIGFISGMDYILTLGNGLGFSGNLSDVQLTSWNGDPLPDLGYWTRFQNGSESVFGVMFSSMGFMSLVFIGFALHLIIYLYKALEPVKVEVGILIILLFFQGIFQEEAFSPYAYGLVMFLGGFYYFQSLSTKAETSLPGPDESRSVN